MKIPYSKLLGQFQYNSGINSDYLWSSMDVEGEDISILLLCLLYHNDLITRKQLCTYFNKYKETSTRKGTSYTEPFLRRMVNTYHSKINDIWYNDYNFTKILLNTCLEKCSNFEMSVDQFLKYLNIGFNKNKNWCIDYLYFQIIKPIINYYDINRTYPILKDFGIEIEFITYGEADRKYDLGSGYCCEDCDGCYSQYKQSKYEHYYKKDNSQTISEKFVTELKKLKTHNKNPNERLNWY